jgi:hypothetical protein
MRRYPVGLQDFGGIIEGKYMYVDKTKYIYDLNENGKYYFLSRPRRFGKSMLTTTMQALFEGKKHLFEGLYVADKWDWETTYPVIRISFADTGFESLGLGESIKNVLLKFAAQSNISIEETTIDQIFKELIVKLSTSQGKVVVLIDEYDKPIIHYLGVDTPKAIENRDIMKNFYSILKEADPHLKMVFITGISKFTKVSIFSDLNNLADISLDNRFAGICGITQEELESNFVEELKIRDKAKIKQWYNGYTWDMKIWVYNPFSLINFFSSGQFRNYWFDSGTPTMLVNLTKEKKLYDFENHKSSLNFLSSFNLENIAIIPLMFQTGYLTFTAYDEERDTCTLNYPNLEVRRSYLELLANAYIYDNEHSSLVVAQNLEDALISENFNEVKTIVNTLFKSLPYTIWQKENEAFFHAILHLTFKLLGIYVQSEVLTSDGRIDSIIHFTDKIYCIEIKLDKSAKEALEQIHEKGYLTPYKNEGKKLIAIGINFSKEKKAVAELESEIVQN